MKEKIAFTAFIFAVIMAAFAASNKVYYVRDGKRYHSSAHCRTLARSKNIQETTLEEAKEKGLTPCKVCYKQ